jgi:enoyl-CoA hydratase/carnithine racemase
MSYKTVLYDVRDGDAQRPGRLNAWNARLGTELGDVIAAADEDDAVRSVVVTGSGRAFCAAPTSRAAGSVAATPRDHGAAARSGRESP